MIHRVFARLVVIVVVVFLFGLGLNGWSGDIIYSTDTRICDEESEKRWSHRKLFGRRRRGREKVRKMVGQRGEMSEERRE